MSAEDDARTACECCEGVAAATPVELFNRPGLSALAYRVGTHGRFLESMQSRISSLAALRALTTRESDDLAVAQMDAWAVVLDVLSFYQERIANEGFLRTATERRSLLQLAAALGYEPRPGVAASVWLAFTLEDAPGAPRLVTIPAGTRALSLPDKEEAPQPFETAVELLARPEWNELRLRTSQPQEIRLDRARYYVRGLETGLEPGRALLVVPPVPAGQSTVSVLRRVAAVKLDAEVERTRVELQTARQESGQVPAEAPDSPASMARIGKFAVEPRISEPLSVGRQPLSGAAVTAVRGRGLWRSQDLKALMEMRDWSSLDLAIALTNLPVDSDRVPAAAARTGPDPGVYALRVTAAGFGYNAPRWSSLAGSMRVGELVWTGKDQQEFKAGAFIHDWDDSKSPHPIDKASDGTKYRDTGTDPVLLLDAVYPGIVAGSWIALEAPGLDTAFLQVVTSDEVFRTDFAISAKVTRLVLKQFSGDDLSKFPLRTTTIFALSERLELADEPIPGPIPKGAIELDLAGLQLELAAGQPLILTGERDDPPGVVKSEPVVLAQVVHDTDQGSTRLTLARGLESGYRRDTVRLNANVVLATHGEAVEQVLGSGDASRPFQRFALSEGPLTWTSAPVPSGAESTLELRVDGVRWHQAPHLYGLGTRDHGYILRQDDTAVTRVIFGDGVRGARLPTGSDNVTAVYRKGIGLAGQVKAGRISLLDTRPLGVDEVINPLPAAGAADRETRDEVRRNAPLTVLTLDRVISLRDHEDFARSFSGIGKARATWVWDGAVRLVHVTVAAPDGGAVPAGSELHRNLLAAMRRLGDPFLPLRIDTFDRLPFNLDLAVRVHPDYRADAVLKAVEQALRETFSFAARDLAQGAALSEVMAVAQRVEGVEAVDVNFFYPAPQTTAQPTHEARVNALPARTQSGGGVAPAQHVSLAAQGLTLGVMR